MENIIIIDQGKGVLGRRGAMDAVRSVTSEDANINSLDNSNIERLRTLISESRNDEYILFINALATRRLSELESVFSEIRQNQGCNIVTPCQIDGETVDLPDLSISALVESVTECDIWPVACIAINAEVLHRHMQDERSISAMIIKSLIDVSIEGQEIIQLNSRLTIENDFGDETCLAYAEQRAQLLNYVVNSCNIEDLFPQQPWDRYSEESAALCYQTLAAHFFKLGAIDDAKECLKFSDQLEDSPRALALKALIALEKGESLGAIANLISSLQQYELRKRDENNDHYLSFTPNDLEKINHSLHKGLEALNKRDNKEAAKFFASAVFDFDDFYHDNGVDSLEMAQ